MLPKIKPTKNVNNNIQGQSLIGIIIAIGIFSLLAHAIFTLVSTSFELTSSNRSRIAANHLAQEKMELIRNLPYDNVGTSGGIPDGPLPQEETIRRNGLNYLVKTSIIYVDDPFDDTAPTDLLPTDYKRVRIDVSWGGLTSSRQSPVVLVTDIAPEGVETTAGGGTLSIFVLDANAEPVPQAEVQIVANDTTPTVNVTLQTGDNGRVLLPGAPTCTSCYQVSATKTGYSTERTYSTSEVANPDKQHASVLEGDLTPLSFFIDQTSTINISTLSDREIGFAALPNTTFTLRLLKEIGTDTQGDKVYKYEESVTTNASGSLQLTDMEWGNYQIIAPSGLDIAGTNPILPMNLSPNNTQDFLISFVSSTDNSLLLGFTDSNEDPIASVSATIAEGVFEESKFSGGESDPDYGQLIFTDLNETTYTLEATASGFIDFSGDFPVSGWTYEIIPLLEE